MKLKERRFNLVYNYLKEYLLETEKDVGVMIDFEQCASGVKALWPDVATEELSYGIRHLIEKGYFKPYGPGADLRSVALTQRGLDEWLFPMNGVDPKKIFLSYAIEDKKLAGAIKRGLEPDLFVFLAHDDIVPGNEWLDMLISNLRTSSVFIALRTKIYSKKSATEQECGFALALDKRIISLCIGTKPSKMGFCSQYQGKSFSAAPDPTQLIIDYCKKQLL